MKKGNASEDRTSGSGPALMDLHQTSEDLGCPQIPAHPVTHTLNSIYQVNDEERTD